MNYGVSVFVFSLLAVAIIERSIRVFFDKRRTSSLVYAASFLWYLILINVFSLLRIPNGAPVVWLTTYFVVSLNFEGSWIKRIVAAISLYSIGVATDLGVLLAFGNIFTTFFGEHVMHTTASMAVSSLCSFMVALLLHKFKNIKKGENVAPLQIVLIVALPSSALAMQILFAVYADMPVFANLLASVILFGTNVFVFYLYDSLVAAHEGKLKSMLHSQEKEYYLAQCRLMQESAERAMSIRHDMKAHLVTLKEFAIKNRADSASEYIDNLLGDIDESKACCETGNLTFDSIINYKLKDIGQSGVKLDMNLQIPPALNVDDADIVTIMGNLLDNALEAVAKVAGEKYIRLSAVLDNGALLIKAENSFDGEVKYLDKKGGQEIASLKGGCAHGHGLKNIKRSVDKYGGYVKIAHADNVFSVKILLKF